MRVEDYYSWGLLLGLGVRVKVFRVLWPKAARAAEGRQGGPEAHTVASPGLVRVEDY